MRAEEGSGERVFGKLCDEIKVRRIGKIVGFQKRAGQTDRLCQSFFRFLKSRPFFSIETAYIFFLVSCGRERAKSSSPSRSFCSQRAVRNGDQGVFPADDQTFQPFFQKIGKTRLLAMPVREKLPVFEQLFLFLGPAFKTIFQKGGDEGSSGEAFLQRGVAEAFFQRWIRKLSGEKISQPRILFLLLIPAVVERKTPGDGFFPRYSPKRSSVTGSFRDS